MPPAMLALYSRWWQLETWLRQLVYVELRARDGAEWEGNLDAGTQKRLKQDRRHPYMASPDWEDPLAYLDAGKLFELIEENWDLFGPTLLEQNVWSGRRAELLKIRHRIGHLRRPHQDDIGRLEQTLRDLEGGAFRAFSSYNHLRDPDTVDPSDPVVNDWLRGNHPDAERLIKHAQSQYDTHFRLRYSVRPWADSVAPGQRLSGQPGVLWHVTLNQMGRYTHVDELWRDYCMNERARELLVHLLIPDEVTVRATFAAVDDPDEISEVIGRILDSVIATSSWHLPERSRLDIMYDPLDDLPPLDPRVQIKTGWTFVDEYTRPDSIFRASPYPLNPSPPAAGTMAEGSV